MNGRDKRRARAKRASTPEPRAPWSVQLSPDAAALERLLASSGPFDHRRVENLPQPAELRRLMAGPPRLTGDLR